MTFLRVLCCSNLNEDEKNERRRALLFFFFCPERPAHIDASKVVFGVIVGLHAICPCVAINRPTITWAPPGFIKIL